jgi:hypothetical protein
MKHSLPYSLLLYLPFIFAMEEQPQSIQPNLAITISKMVNKQSYAQCVFASNRLSDENKKSVIDIVGNRCTTEAFTECLHVQLSDINPLIKVVFEDMQEKIIAHFKQVNGNTLNTIATTGIIAELPQSLQTVLAIKALRTIKGHFIIPLPKELLPRTVYSINDTQHLIAFYFTQQVELFDLKTGKIILTIHLPISHGGSDSTINSCCTFNQPGTHLALANKSKTVFIYNPRTGQLFTTITYPTEIYSVYFTQKQHFLVGQSGTHRTNYIAIPYGDQNDYSTPEYIGNDLYYTRAPSCLYKHFTDKIQKLVDYRFMLTHYAVQNSTERQMLEIIKSSSFFNALTDVEKDKIRAHIKAKKEKLSAIVDEEEL